MMADLKTKLHVSYRVLARQMGLSYATLMRWKQRTVNGGPALEKPGPKKVAPLDLGQLKEKIADMDHGTRRTHGVGALHSAYGDAISRRELNEMIGQVRRETNRRKASEKYRITWLAPNLAWAMDDCERACVNGAVLHLHNLSDLCSRYKLPPIASDQMACGEEVAGHLDRLFARFAPPLFCKRDNGGNLNHLAVDQVLAEAMVIPINSPVAMAPYNGAIEHTQGEFKSYLARWEEKAASVRESTLLAETAAHELNHRPRRSLTGQTACRAYFGRDRLRYPKRRRLAVYRWIKELAERIAVDAGKDAITPTAWRVAAKQWLVKNRLIRIVKAGNVLPNLSLEMSHN